MPTTTNNPQPPIYKRSLPEIWEATKDFFHDLVELREGMDREGTLENIHNNKRMRGSNAWLLMCSIMVASLGLDLNSPAVIIGAMLISPLMSPILGIGLGIGINDKRTMLISLQHFGIAIAIALVTSVLYFKLTPFGTITTEIMNRTSPTLLDGLVAIFGGLAGVISITRKDKSNAVPGVAIATALMPPLCVAGYGLANGNWPFFLNAFYLFFLNSFFIAITTYLIIRLLRFPYKKYMNIKERNRNRLYIIFFSAIILIPALNILFKTIRKANDKKIIDTYLKANIQDKRTILSDWAPVKEEEGRNDTMQIILKLIGEPLSKMDINKADEELEAKLGKPIDIITYQSEEIPIEDIRKLKNQVSGEISQKLQSLESQTVRLSQIEANILALQQNNQQQIDSLEIQDIDVLYKKIKVLFPSIKEIAIAKNVSKTNFVQAQATELPMVFVKWDAKKSSSQRKLDQEKLAAYIKMEAPLDTLQLVAY